MGQLGLTTPFGRRAVTLEHVVAVARIAASLKDQQENPGNHPSAVDKWRIFRLITAVREKLNLSDRTLSLLQALLSFHPETALTVPGRWLDGSADESSIELVVFPSNRQLALRANGMAEKTIRRHLAALVGAGLILRRDSANGKRYSRRAEGKEERFSEAFGFDLTPLVLRAHEFEDLAEDIRREERRRVVLKERISLLRRSIGQRLALASDEGLAGDWESLRRRFLALQTPVRRIKGFDGLELMASGLATLAGEVEARLAEVVESNKMTGNAGDCDRHISISNTESSIDLEPALDGAGRFPDGNNERPAVLACNRDSEPCVPALVREACPDMADYADGELRDWRDIISAARAIRPMLGISPDAWSSAVQVLGERSAAAAVGLILQRSEFSSEASKLESVDGRVLTAVNGSPAVRSPGGYLRSLTRKAQEGDFSLGSVLMATIGQRLKMKRQTRR